MTYLINELAKLAGISVRTFHHYDKIGLLKAESRSSAGYRVYQEEDVNRLQQILFFKTLGFSLRDIKHILEQPNYNPIEALQLQAQLLSAKQSQIQTQLDTIHQTLNSLQGGYTMTDQDKFRGLDFDENPYLEEAKERWGQNKVAESQERIKQLSSGLKAKISEDWDRI